jgi:hypothetical protein
VGFLLVRGPAPSWVPPSRSQCDLTRVSFHHVHLQAPRVRRLLRICHRSRYRCLETNGRPTGSSAGQFLTHPMIVNRGNELDEIKEVDMFFFFYLYAVIRDSRRFSLVCLFFATLVFSLLFLCPPVAPPVIGNKKLVCVVFLRIFSCSRISI